MVVIALAAVLLLVFLTRGCSTQSYGQRAKSASVPTWQEQYDLGIRFLSEGNYEEAIIAFTAAIEIDPKQPEGYLGLADAYVAQDDIIQAIQILRDAEEHVEKTYEFSMQLEKLEQELSQEFPSRHNAASTASTSEENLSYPIQISEDEIVELLEGYWTWDDPNHPVDPNSSEDIRYGGLKFFVVYSQDDMAQYGVGVWNSGRGRMGAMITDVWQQESTVYSFTANFPEVPPTLMDSEGSPAYACEVWIDTGTEGDGRLFMRLEDAAEYQEYFYTADTENFPYSPFV